MMVLERQSIDQFEAKIEKILQDYPPQGDLINLPVVLAKFRQQEKGKINDLIAEMVNANPEASEEELSKFFMKVFRRHFNI